MNKGRVIYKHNVYARSTSMTPQILVGHDSTWIFESPLIFSYGKHFISISLGFKISKKSLKFHKFLSEKVSSGLKN